MNLLCSPLFPFDRFNVQPQRGLPLGSCMCQLSSQPSQPSPLLQQPRPALQLHPQQQLPLLLRRRPGGMVAWQMLTVFSRTSMASGTGASRLQ